MDPREAAPSSLHPRCQAAVTVYLLHLGVSVLPELNRECTSNVASDDAQRSHGTAHHEYDLGGAEVMRDEARRMVVTMVEMERSYLTAEVFKEILSQNGRSAELGADGLIRTLSGTPSPLLHVLNHREKRLLFCQTVAGANQLPLCYRHWHL